MRLYGVATAPAKRKQALPWSWLRWSFGHGHAYSSAQFPRFGMHDGVPVWVRVLATPKRGQAIRLYWLRQSIAWGYPSSMHVLGEAMTMAKPNTTSKQANVCKAEGSAIPYQTMRSHDQGPGQKNILCDFVPLVSRINFRIRYHLFIRRINSYSTSYNFTNQRNGFMRNSAEPKNKLFQENY
jgi:hypothetical protein